MTAATSYRHILENLATAVLVLDARLKVTAANPAAEMLLQLSRKQIERQRLPDLAPNNAPFLERLNEAARSGHPFTERDLDLHLPGARRLPVDCSVNVVPGIAAHDVELIVEIQPVDHLQKLSREGNLLDRHEANRAVIRGLAHEIKNPLGGLRGAAQLLERELKDKALKDYTRIIMREADRLRALVDRMIGPNRPLKLAPVNVHQVFEHIRSLMLAEIPQGLRVERDYDPSLPEIAGDFDQLIQAFLNIVRNAVQAAGPQGTVRLRTRVERQFTVGTRRYRLVLRAEVEDDGPGIPDDLKDRIFYPMITGRADGSGLGLSIAESIVHRHGGLIEFRSRPRQTVFTVYLPLGDAHG